MAGFIVFPDKSEWKSSSVFFRNIIRETLSMLDCIKERDLIEILSQPLKSNVNILCFDELQNSALYISFLRALKAALERRKRDQLEGFQDSDEFLPGYIGTFEDLVKKAESAK